MLKELSFQNNVFLEKDVLTKASPSERLNNKLLVSNKLKVFVVNVGGILGLVHSLKRYEGGLDEECTYDEEIIGWVGDRTQKRDPKVVVIDGPDMQWKKVSVYTSKEGYTSFYNDKANRKSFIARRRMIQPPTLCFRSCCWSHRPW